MPAAAVITYGSSFGYVATALASRVPYYVQHLYEDHVYRDPESIGGKAVPLEDRCIRSLRRAVSYTAMRMSTPCRC